MKRFRVAAIDGEVGLERHRTPKTNLVQLGAVGVLIWAAWADQFH
jgi:hypothetical protein